MDVLDENGIPQCIRTIRLFDHMEEEIITSFAVYEPEELILFGCENGRVFYNQGMLQRSVQSMLSLFPPHLSSAITNLHVTYDPTVGIVSELRIEDPLSPILTSNTSIFKHIQAYSIILNEGCENDSFIGLHAHYHLSYNADGDWRLSSTSHFSQGCGLYSCQR